MFWEAPKRSNTCTVRSPVHDRAKAKSSSKCSSTEYHLDNGAEEQHRREQTMYTPYCPNPKSTRGHEPGTPRRVQSNKSRYPTDSNGIKRIQRGSKGHPTSFRKQKKLVQQRNSCSSTVHVQSSRRLGIPRAPKKEQQSTSHSMADNTRMADNALHSVGDFSQDTTNDRNSQRFLDQTFWCDLLASTPSDPISISLTRE